MFATAIAMSPASASPTFHATRTAPRTIARTIAILFLLTIVAGILAQVVVSERLVVSRDPAATANNILGHASLFRTGFTMYLIEMILQVAMTVLFYELLEPVNRTLAMLSAALGYVGCGIKAMSRLFFLAPLFVLAGTRYAGAFDPAQRHALSSLLLQLNDYGAGMSLAFMGVSTLLQGYLILRSTFLPRSLGVLTMAGGLGWMTFLSPTLGLRLFPAVAGIGLLGSIAMILWLLIVGVDEARWREQAAVSGAAASS